MTEPAAALGGNPLHTAIAAAMATLTRLAEHGVNKHQNYAYVTESDIFEAVRPGLAAQGVTVIQEHGEIIAERDNPTSGGGTMHEATVAFDFILTHGPSGVSERYRFLGVGADTGDKWYTKASTSAAKFFIRRMFLISAGGAEDPDGGGYERGAQQTQQRAARGGQQDTPISEAQEKRLWAIAREHGVENDDVHRIVWAVTSGATTHVSELPRKKGGPYDKAVDAIEKWSPATAEALAKYIDENPLPADTDTSEQPPAKTDPSLPEQDQPAASADEDGPF